MKYHTALALTLFVLAGCGGGGHASAPSVPGNSTANGSQSGTMSLTFGTQTGVTSANRKPLFVSPNATSAVVDINNGTPATFDVSATSALCQTASGVRTCSIPLTAPLGQDAIGVALMASLSGNATMLGQGSNSVTVAAGTNFSLTVGINPIVAGANSISFSTGATLVLTYGTPATVTGTPIFADPANTPITGSGNVPNFLTPLAVTSSDPHVAVTPALLTTPGQTFTVTYDGSAAVASTVVVAVKSGTTPFISATAQLPGLANMRFNLGAANTITPQQMAVGPDGNVWVALQSTNDIAQITPAGVVTDFPTGIAGGHPFGLAVGADGNIYYGDNNSCTIGRMNVSGIQVGGLAAAAGGGCALWQFGTDGASGNIWFIDSAHNAVGFISEATWPSPGTECGALPTAFSISINQTMTVGSDGAMWFTEGGNGKKIGRYQNAAACTGSVLTEYQPPSAQNHDLAGLARASDGNLWFTEVLENLYGKITPAGVITEYAGVINGAAFANPAYLIAGPDGQLWIPQGGGALSFNPATPATNFVQLFAGAGQNNPGQTDNHSAILGPDNQIWYSGLGSAGGGGFLPQQDQVGKFVTR